MSELKPCPICGKELYIHGPEDWTPTFYDPDSGGDPYSADCDRGFSFCNNSYDYKEFVTALNCRAEPANAPLAQERFEQICEAVHNGWWEEKKRQGVTDHPDMIPYCDLSESVKEYDRVTVRRVLDALNVGNCSDNVPLTLDELPTCASCENFEEYENEVEYGYPSPCTNCKRRVSDNYRRKPDGSECNE